MALRRRSLVTVTTLRRLAFVGTVLVGCAPREAPPPPPSLPSPPPPILEPAITVLVPMEDDASVDAAPAASPVPVRASMSVEAFCPELAEEEPSDAGTAPAPPAPLGTNMAPPKPGIDVRFRTSRTPPTREGIANHFESRALKADVVVPSRGVTREVFRMTIADPVQCCAKAGADSLVSNCMFSGIDAIHGRSITKREGDAIVIRWCVANLSTRQVMDRGEQKVPLPAGTPVRFVAPAPACDPKSIP